MIGPLSRRWRLHDSGRPDNGQPAADILRQVVPEEDRNDDLVARTVHVRGFVQGVFFREGCRRTAERLGVSGTVENLRDGRVRACFEGPKAAVDQLIDWCHEGTDRSRVEGVDVEPAEPSGRRGFLIQGRD